MKKAICLAVAMVMVMAVAGVASAENKIGVGYYFQGDSSVLTLAGELSLSDKMAFGFDYVGKEVSETELYGKLALQSFGSTSVGAFGGVKLVEGDNANTFKIGVYGQQPVSPQIDVYARGGVAFKSGVNSWFEVLGGLKANVMSPFWLAGEALYSSQQGADGTAFRLLVGMNF
ncbi:MAG: hypothetical protein PWR07_1584 [Bacillota bacterium]|nr:hypothetical protein [Bacillota bacterium]MDI6638373.1 hypothetical protein [Bacillota bacterium]MDK2931453.1 hypothetical protein [Bacillota bacterium]